MIFLPRVVFDFITQSTESSTVNARKDLNQCLQVALDAKTSEVRAIVAAKDEELAFLRAHIDELKSAVAHERTRAEAAVDQLLNLASVAPIRNADLQRDAAEKEAANPEMGKGPTPHDRLDAMAKIFAQINSVGQDDDGPEPYKTDEKLMVAGVEIARGDGRAS